MATEVEGRETGTIQMAMESSCMWAEEVAAPPAAAATNAKAKAKGADGSNADSGQNNCATVQIT